MSISASGTVSSKYSYSYLDTSIGGNVTANLNYDASESFETGTGDGQINRIHAAPHTIAASGGTLALNLQGGFTGPFSGTYVMDTVKYIFVKLLSGGPSSITVTFGGALGTTVMGGAGRIMTINDGGHFKWVDPNGGITLGSGDTLTITNAGGTDASVVVATFGVDS